MGLAHKSETKAAVLLVGGHSRRMGRDKFLIAHNGIAHWQYMLQRLDTYFEQVYISCRPDQVAHFTSCQVIVDQYGDIGPMGAICSAFQQLESYDKLFFVGCDLPNFEIEIAQKLYDHMAPSDEVCCAQSTEKAFPEPLVAIWKRAAISEIQTRIAAGDYALFKCMKNLAHSSVSIPESLLKNANRLEDL